MEGKNPQYDPKHIAMKRLYVSPRMKHWKGRTMDTDYIQRVYQGLSFPNPPPDRPYAYGCFVSSVDGAIVFPDSPDGTQIARCNTADPFGAKSDFWLLNLLRASADGVVIGGNTLRSDPRMSARIHIAKLREAREAAGFSPVPLQIIPTAGKDFPVNHPLITAGDQPVLVVSSETGMDLVTGRLKTACRTYDAHAAAPPSVTGNELKLLTCGKEELDIPRFHAWLKQAGIEHLLVESPRYFSALMGSKTADELFLSVSSLFIGGEMQGFLSGIPAFTTDSHPEGRMLTVHIHGEGFLFLRYCLDSPWTREAYHIYN